MDQSQPFSPRPLHIRKGRSQPPALPLASLCPAPRWASQGECPGQPVLPWAEPGLALQLLGWHCSSWAGRALALSPAPAPSSCARHSPQLLPRPIRGGFAAHTEPGWGYKCWLLHDMGHNWDIRQLLETALLLHANECFCCRIFCESPARPCRAAGSGTLRDDVGVAV